MDGANRGSHGLTAYASIFRGSMGKFVGGFSSLLGVQSSLFVELMALS